MRLDLIALGLPHFTFPTFLDCPKFFEIGLSLSKAQATVGTTSDIRCICLALAVVVPKANLANFVFPLAI